MEVEERYPDGFVSDRAFDNLAYAARHSLVISSLLDAEALRYFQRVRESLVLFVRPHRECMANDGVRENVEWDEINKIDGILDFLLGWQQVPCIGISELNMKDRVRTAMAAVKLYQRACIAAPDTRPVAAQQISVAATAVLPPPRKVNINGHQNGHGNGHPELAVSRS
jgi:hypothetical protein